MPFAQLGKYLEHWAEQTPDRLFLCSASQRISFSAAAAMVEKQAASIAERSDGKAVVITGANSLEWVLQLLAMFRLGAPAVLLPSGIPPAEAQRFTALSGARLLVEGAHFTRLPAAGGEDQSETLFSSGACVAFSTSGTTGAAKLVLRSAVSLMEEGLRYQRVWELTAEDTVMAVLPLPHAYVLGSALAGTLVAGCSLYVTNFVSHRTLSSEICQSETTVMPLVGPLAQALALGDSGTRVSSRLRVAMVGAGAASERTVEGFFSRWGIRLSQNYGSAETGGLLSSFYPDSLVATGYAMPGVACVLTPMENGRGQLWVRLNAPPLGYLTEEGWDRNRLGPDGWWATGDVFTDDPSGRFSFRQRLGGAIRKGGKTIEPREVEKALREHPGVEDVCVLREEDGEGQEHARAWIETAPGVALQVNGLREFLRTRLAEYKIPTLWTISDKLPRTWSGKPDALSMCNAPARSTAAGLVPQLMSYRISEALLVAEKLGLMERLAQSPAPVETIAGEMGLDTAALRVFFTFLERAGLVAGHEEGWSLREKLPRDWKQICALEQALQQSWLSAPVLEQVLRSGLDDRCFDRGGASPEFTRAYANAMGGPSLTLALRHLLRTIKPSPAANILEIGRCVGNLSGILSTHTGKLHVIPVGPSPAVFHPQYQPPEEVRHRGAIDWADVRPPAGEFGAILLVNCVHLIPPALANETFRALWDGLAPGGTLAILDSFLPLENASVDPRSLFLLDWMTHGGCYWLFSSELTEQLRSSGFEDIEIKTFPPLSTQWLIGARPPVSTAGQAIHLEEPEHQGA